MAQGFCYLTWFACSLYTFGRATIDFFGIFVGGRLKVSSGITKLKGSYGV